MRSNGTLACWGSNSYGESTPPAGSYLRVAASQQYSCATRPDWSVTCWGRNDTGQATPPSSATSVPLPAFAAWALAGLLGLTGGALQRRRRAA